MIWKVFIVSFKLTFLLWEAQLGCALHCKTLHGCYGLIHKIWAGLRTSWGTLLKFVKTSEDLLFCLIPPLLLYAADTYQHHRWIISPSCLEKGEPLFKSQHWVKPLVPTCWEFKYCICSKYTLFFPSSDTARQGGCTLACRTPLPLNLLTRVAKDAALCALALSPAKLICAARLMSHLRTGSATEFFLQCWSKYWPK